MAKKNSLEFDLRPARSADARQIAQLIDMASSGLESWDWAEKLTNRQKARGMVALDIGEAEVRDPDHYFAYGHVTVAEVGGKLAGMSLNHVIQSKSATELAALSPVNRVYADLKQHAVGSYYIDSLACLPEFRGRGLGSLLIKDAIEKARAGGHDKICLLAFEENVGAARLYQAMCFCLVTKLTVVAAPHMPFAGHILLLSRDL